MNSSSSDRRSEGFFTGKGFYIVLFLCAAVIGVSAWVMATGNEAMKESEMTDLIDGHRVETVIAPATDDWIDETELAPPEIRSETPAEPAVEEPGETAPAAASAPAVYAWPVLGEIAREYTVSALRYDETMRDWRTHSGVDIACDSGAKVFASRGGKIESIVSDGLYGTTVTIDHGDGMRSVYANLDAETAVKAGEWVDTGVLLGTVGASALCEIGQPTHLHFEMRLNGALVDPAAYLSA